MAPLSPAANPGETDGLLRAKEWAHEMTVPQRGRLVEVDPPVEDEDARLVRNVSVASLVAFVVVTVLLTALYRQVVLTSLRELAVHENVKLTRAFADLLWPRFLAFVGSASGLRPEALQKHPAVADLREAVLEQMRGTSVVKVKLYDVNGLTVFSTQTDQIGDDQGQNPGVLAALQDQVTSDLTYRDTFNAFDGEIEDRHVLASYLPIRRSGSTKVEAVFELYDDVTPLVRAMQRAERRVVGGVVAILGALYGVLFLVMRRADRIIRDQRRERKRQHELRLSLEAQLRQKQKMEAIGTLAGGIAHDFNNILEAILACADLSLRELPRQSPVREKVAEIEGAARYGADLVSQILAFSRPERQSREPIDPRVVVEDAVGLLEAALPTGVTLRRRLFACGEVVANASELHQIVVNLVRNACQATRDAGGGVVEVALEPLDATAGSGGARPDLPEGRYVCLSVCDKGGGIDEETMGRIFDPFFTTKDPGDGVGLGLAIVQAIVDGLEGILRVGSTPGRGSVFQVFIPRHGGGSAPKRVDRA